MSGLIVDRMSAPYVEGASIIRRRSETGFTIDNLTPPAPCACGDSFN